MKLEPSIPQNFEPLSSNAFEKSVGQPKAVFETKCTNDIMKAKYPPIVWVVEGYLPEGLSILAGRQKLGKTWLAIDWAIAVATDGYAMGQANTTCGDVLYIDMENGDRRIQRRVEKIFPHRDKMPDLSRLRWAGEVIPLNKGFIEAIDRWRISVEKPRLVVIDVLQRIKPAGAKSQNAYENDYSVFAGLQSWAMQNGVAVLALHHTRKGGADDPLEALTGSNGLSACADTTLVLDRNGSGITLYVRGRDVEEKESALQFDAGVWSLMGEADEFRRSKERVRILVTLEQADEPMSPQLLSDVTGMKSSNVRRLLHSMLKAGEVSKCGRGQYIHPSKAPLDDVSGTPGNNGNKVRNPTSNHEE